MARQGTSTRRDMGMARRFATVAAIAVAALACAVPATAATPVVVGQAQLGGTPDIAVDGAGTAHIVWEETSSAVCVPRTRKLVRKLRRSSPTTKAFNKKLKKRSCKARKPIGRILKQVPAGQNSIVWNGRLAGRKLRPGRYFALLQIRDGAGNFSAVETIRFRVLKPKKRRG
jgi:hypothetical protein